MTSSMRFAFIGLTITLAACQEYDLAAKEPAEVGVVPNIQVDPPSLEFAQLSTGETETQQFTVTNIGDEALDVSGIEVVVGNAFIIDTTDLNFVLDPSDSRSIDVTFTPLGVESYGTIEVYSNDPDSPAVPVDLLGFGGVPELQIDPASHAFTDTFIPCGAEVDVEFKNIGSEPLEVTDVSYLSGGQLTFDPRGHAVPFTLDPGEAIMVGVVFEATSTGADTGTIEVTSNDPRGVVTADQSGEGAYVEEVTEVFTEPGIPPVDVIWQIDQSCSMAADNRQDIRDGVPAFLAELQNVADYHLIQVTKDTGCANGGVLTNSTPNAEQLLIDNAFNAGPFEQWTTEQLLKQTNISLLNTDAGECNEGFLRPGALLHVIIASDEEDASPNNFQHWLDLYENYVTDPALLKVSAIVDINYNCGDGSGPGGYLEAANATGGTVLNICSPTWGAQMTDIASEVLAGIRSYNLSQGTEASTVVVEINGVETTDITFTGAGSTVTINSPPVGEGDVVEITYNPAATCP